MKSLIISQKKMIYGIKKKVVKFLNENNEEITMLMNDKEFRNALFVKYPVQQLK